MAKWIGWVGRCVGGRWVWTCHRSDGSEGKRIVREARRVDSLTRRCGAMATEERERVSARQLAKQAAREIAKLTPKQRAALAAMFRKWNMTHCARCGNRTATEDLGMLPDGERGCPDCVLLEATPDGA